jgi:hypothetical protein
MKKIDDSHLFLVRLWQEADGDGQREWCGRVQHIVTGRSMSFRAWPALVENMLALVPGERIQDGETTNDEKLTGREDNQGDH